MMPQGKRIFSIDSSLKSALVSVFRIILVMSATYIFLAQFNYLDSAMKTRILGLLLAMTKSKCYFSLQNLQNMLSYLLLGSVRRAGEKYPSPTPRNLSGQFCNILVSEIQSKHRQICLI